MRTKTASALSGSLLLLALTACGGDGETSAAEPTPSESSSSTPSSSPSDAGESPASTAETANAAFLDRMRSGIGQSGSVHVSMKMTGGAGMAAEGDTVYGPD